MQRYFATVFFILCFVVVLYFSYKILEPFLTPIVWAIILTTAFYRSYHRLRAALKGRSALSAAIMCVLIVAMIVLPIVLLTVALARESVDAFNLIQEKIRQGEFDRLLHWQESGWASVIYRKVDKFINIEQLDLKSSAVNAVKGISAFFVTHSSQIITGFTGFLASFFFTVMTMFFLFVDGEAIIEKIKKLNPLPRDYEQLVLLQFKEVISATLYGNLITALAQGVAGGLIFLIFGIPSPILWGAAMALLSLVPLVGTALVWVPVGLYLLLTGAIGKGIGLMVLCGIIVGSLDNFLRPLLIRGKANLHTLLVFFAVLGGLKVFGFLGVVLGPLILAIFITFLNLYEMEFREGLARK